MARLSISLLGNFQVTLDGELVTNFESNKVRGLLAYLAVEADRSHTRESLTGLLWPDMPQRSANSNLRNALANLRGAIGDRDAQPPYLKISREYIQINPDADINVDLWNFKQGIKSAGISTGQSLESIKQLKETIFCYRGPFLEGFSFPENIPFEEWIAAIREKIKQEMLYALRILTDALTEKGDTTQALVYARRQLEIEPWLEEAHQQVMRLLAFDGHRGSALAQYETCRKLLNEALGVNPGKATNALYEKIRDGVLGKPTLDRPTHQILSSIRRKHNLPEEVNQFFGREDEISQIKDRLDRWRLVTLTGPGGIGKTRLALQVARSLLNEFQDGVWLFRLAALTDPDLVFQQVADMLGLRVNRDDSTVDLLKTFLRDRQILLVLDNCEHLLQACGRLVGTLLAECPKLKFLTTSREPIGLPGEAVTLVSSLPYPKSEQQYSSDYLESSPSILLFIDRTQSILPMYQPSEQDMAAIARISQRLDGIPLAIELAAARMNILTVSTIEKRLEDRFQLLTGGSPTALPRQQTLRAAIDWSYKLLGSEERLLLCRLAVFVGGWDLVAAEKVCSGEGLDVNEILDLMGSLVNKSMVLVDRSKPEGIRYSMLETIHHFAREKLLDFGETEKVQNRYLEYFLRFAENIEWKFPGPEGVQKYVKLEPEIDNFRQAIEVSFSINPQSGLRLASILLWFFLGKGYVIAIRGWLERLLSMDENISRDTYRAQALVASAWSHHPIPEYQNKAKEALDICRDINDVPGQGQAHLCLGWYGFSNPLYYSSSRMHLNSALEIFEELEEHYWVTQVYFGLSLLASAEANISEQQNFLNQALDLCNKTESWIMAARLSGYLGEVIALKQGDLRRGKKLIEESLEFFRQHQLSQLALVNYYNYITVLIWQGEYQKTEFFLNAMLTMNENSDDYYFKVGYLLGAGRFYCLLGRLDEGINLLEQTLKDLDEPSPYYYLLREQQTHILELAYALACLDEVDRSRNLIDQFWDIFQEPVYQPRLKKVLGFLRLLEGDGEDAVHLYKESLRFADEQGQKLQALLALEGYAWSLQVVGKSTEAVRLLPAASAFRERIGAVVFPRDRPKYERMIEVLRSELGPDSYTSTWEEGNEMSFEATLQQVFDHH